MSNGETSAAVPDPRTGSFGPTTHATLPGLPPAWNRLRLIGAWLAAGRRRFHRWLAGAALSRATLGGRRPATRLSCQPDPLEGRAEVADALFQGRYCFAGETHLAPNQSPWALTRTGGAWAEGLHDFTWLRHFRAADGPAARRQVRALVDGWLQRYGRFEPQRWRPDLAGRRLAAWASHLDLILDGADLALRLAVLESFGRQIRYVARSHRALVPGRAEVEALTGEVLGRLALGLWGGRLGRALRRLDRAVDSQLQPDGGHASRNPSDHFTVLTCLVRLRDALVQAGLPPSPALVRAIDRMAPVLRFFRLGDGRLALFNGGVPEDPEAIERILSLAAPRGRAPDRCPHTGYERVAGRRLTLVIDVGPPPPPGLSDGAHAAPLAFELSCGHDRLIGACGAGQGLGPEWRRVARATAAHSTLVVDDQNAWAFVADRLLGMRPALPPPDTQATRNEAGGQVWLEASHNGYAGRFGLIHRRNLWVSADGDEIRGEDRIEPRGRGAGRSLPFALRFHLGQGVQASLTGDGTTALLRSPGGEGWRLQALGAPLALVESVDMAEPGAHRRAEQLVLAGTLDSGRVTLRWQIARADAPAR